MRSLALTALLGSFIASTSLFGQSLTEHAAAAAGATIGTAAGKPLGTALGKIFGDVDQSTNKAAKTAKPAQAKPAAVTPPETPVAPPAATLVAPAPIGGADAAVGGGGGSCGAFPGSLPLAGFHHAGNAHGGAGDRGEARLQHL